MFDISSFLNHDDTPDFLTQDAIAVALSGGPDSLALAHMMAQWSAQHDGPVLHCLSVDHGLRAESEAQARQVLNLAKDWPKTQPHLLTWQGDKPQTRLMEEARKARYRLMRDYCGGQQIRYLFLGHHMDDQAETVLFRLAKGSGPDGLAGMSAVQDYDGLVLIRPFLKIRKALLVEYCIAQSLPYIKDPSNESPAFARVRLRGSMDVLAQEGLTPERLSITAERMARAREALGYYADQAWNESLLQTDTDKTVFKKDLILKHPPEILIRVVDRALQQFLTGGDYGPRTARVEQVAFDLKRGEAFRKRTLGGAIIRRDDRAGVIVIEKEKP